MQFFQIYHPVTATPFACDKNYMEFEPCQALKPFIRCFWGTKKPVSERKTGADTSKIVIPDTCMDILFEVDFTSNKIVSQFCGIDDRTFCADESNETGKKIFKFGIRFYAWSAVLFAEESMRGVRNAFFEVDCHFSKIKRAIEPLLFDVPDMNTFIPVVEKVLLKHFYAKHENPLVTEAVSKILLSKGNLKATALSKALHISHRQLERLFQEYIGVAPKNFASMVRYQYLWNEILYSPQFDILDAVYQYGYTDQAHMLRDFKKFHSMNITEARRYALKDVAFLQG